MRARLQHQRRKTISKRQYSKIKKIFDDRIEKSLPLSTASYQLG